MIDLDQWMAERGISPSYGRAVAVAIKKKYPALASALKAYPDVTGELELVQLVHDLHNFKLTPQHLDELCKPERTEDPSV